MSEVPTTNTSWTRKKVAGIPLLYLVGGFVVILVAIAWKTKSTSSSATPTPDPNATPTDPGSDTILSEQGNALPPIPVGTVVAPQNPQTDTGNSSIDTNDEWLRRGVAFLIDKGSNPGDAQGALMAYLDGNELTYQQGVMRDDAIRELGLPPTPVTYGGNRPDVARVQGPLPRNHIVKSTVDDTATELASLYYGRNDTFAVGTITAANGGRGTFNVGESVMIPVLPKPTTPPTQPKPVPVTSHPTPPPPKPKRYYTVRSGDSLSSIAKHYYGNAAKWTVIYNANRSKIKNPNVIYPGQVFLIP